MFKDVAEFLEIQPKRLPIKGKVYDFPGSVSAKTGVLLHLITAQVAKAQEQMEAGGDTAVFDETVLNDVEEEDLRREVLGDTEAQLIEDGVEQVYVEHAFRTLVAWHQFGEDVARAVWEDVDGGPKVKIPTDHRPKSRKGSSASASTTRKRASTRATSRSTSESPGDESSSTGD